MGPRLVGRAFLTRRPNHLLTVTNPTTKEGLMTTLDDVQTWRGKTMVDEDGDKVGTIEDVFLDRQTGEPAWLAVKTGLFGLQHTLVPIRGAQLSDDDTVRVPLQKEKVKDAPRIDPDGELSPDDERKLWEHYGMSDYDEWQGEDRTRSLALPDEDEDRARAAEGEAGEGEPRVVGVRLRRVIVVAAPVGDRDAR
jgi:sporulation protein YlmC with PRC-barrel domain